MKIVVYTQRVEIIETYGERRDCADQNIPRFIRACGYLPVSLPNIWDITREILTSVSPTGVILTGGNSLQKCGGEAAERDEMEKKILDYALQRNVPVFGFCRGMQVIVDYFGGKLGNVEGHVAVRHKISGEIERKGVNSFHGQACYDVNQPLEILAKAEDGVLEAVCNREKKILGIMWHPEREDAFRDCDIKLVQRLFG